MNKSPANSPPGPDPKWDDDDPPWRHPPVAPKDPGLAESLGRSISEVVTGPLDPAAGKPGTKDDSKPTAKP